MAPDVKTVLRLGYLLVRTGVHLPWSPQRGYRGIDRLPYLPNPMEDATARTAMAWNAYSDAVEEGRLGRDFALAQDICQELNAVGAKVDVIFADVESLPDEPPNASERVLAQRFRSLEWLRNRSAEIPVPDRRLQPIGFDVSTPVPNFHSAIAQPGLIRQDSALAANLNDSGLFDDFDTALGAAAQANNSGYGLALFCVIRLFSEPSSN
jgi:hypothetical protein